MFKIIANIEGMNCGMCEAHVNEAIKSAFKVKKVVSSHAQNTTVILSGEKIDQAKLKDVVADAGYELISVKVEEYKKKGFSFFGK